MEPLQEQILKNIELLRQATREFPPTLTTALVKEYGQDPFIILISCLLSLRARDTMTYPVSRKLFALARTPQEIAALPLPTLEELFHSLGFFRVKARRVKEVSQELLNRFGGRVPGTEEELLSLKGVGRKTANLVLGSAFNIPAICVDTHVHRIANRLGWIATKTPEETEQALKRVIPQKYWIEVNTLLVLWGQNVCLPSVPRCSSCVLNPFCPKIGVTRKR